jgi:hypothetical protein
VLSLTDAPARRKKKQESEDKTSTSHTIGDHTTRPNSATHLEYPPFATYPPPAPYPTTQFYNPFPYYGPPPSFPGFPNPFAPYGPHPGAYPPHYPPPSASIGPDYGPLSQAKSPWLADWLPSLDVGERGRHGDYFASLVTGFAAVHAFRVLHLQKYTEQDLQQLTFYTKTGSEFHVTSATAARLIQFVKADLPFVDPPTPEH